MVGRIESLCNNLSNVVMRLLGGMMMEHPTKAKEMEVDDLTGFLDKQTNIIVQAIQTLLMIIKNPATVTAVINFLVPPLFFHSLSCCSREFLVMVAGLSGLH